MSVEQLTNEEKSLICQSLIQVGLKQPKWQGLVNSTIEKLGLMELAEKLFEHYKRKAESRILESN